MKLPKSERNGFGWAYTSILRKLCPKVHFGPDYWGKNSILTNYPKQKTNKQKEGIKYVT